MNFYTSCGHVKMGACSYCAAKLETERDHYRDALIKISAMGGYTFQPTEFREVAEKALNHISQRGI